MKKRSSNKASFAHQTQVAIAVAMLTGSILAVPEIVCAAETVHLWLKNANVADIQASQKYTIVGSQDNHTVYKTSSGQFFYLNQHGDMQFVIEGVFKFFRPNPKGDGTTEGVYIKRSGTDIKGGAQHLSVVGSNKGQPVYQNEKGESFTLDANGDQKFLPGKFYSVAIKQGRGESLESKDHKHPDDVFILGVDANGHTINQNERGEKFFVNPDSGDFTFVDGKNLTLFHAPDSNLANLTARKAGEKPVEYLQSAKVQKHNDIDVLAWSWGMSQQGTLAWSWGETQSGTMNKGEPRSPGVGDPVFFEGKQGVLQLQNGTPTINWGDGTSSSSGSKGGGAGAGKALSSFFDIFIERSAGNSGNHIAGGITHEDTWDANKSLPAPNSNELPGKHHYIGVVTLLKGMAPNPKGDQSSGPESISLNFTHVEYDYHEIGHEGAGFKVSATPDEQGNFSFPNLPEGDYTLSAPGQPGKPFTVAADEKFGGKVMRGGDGKMMIFDRWANLISEAAPKGTTFGDPGDRVTGDVIEPGRRQYEPLLIRKRLDAASPLQVNSDTGDSESKTPGVALSESPSMQSKTHEGAGGGAGKVNFQDFHYKTSKGNAGVQPDKNTGSGEPAGMRTMDGKTDRRSVSVQPADHVGVGKVQAAESELVNGVKLPDPKAGDRTDPNAPSHTVPPPKIGNDKPVKADTSPGGFGSGGPVSPGSSPAFGGMGNTPGPSMIPVPPMPSMPSMGGPGTQGPMSPMGRGGRAGPM